METVFAQLGALSMTGEEAVPKLEMVALPRSEMSELDMRIVDFVVGVFTLQLTADDIETVAGRIAAVETDMSKGKAVSLYCLYAWVMFRQHMQYLHVSLCGTALYEPVYAWFTKWMTGEVRRPIDDAMSAGAHLMSVTELSAVQTKQLNWFFATSAHLMDFVARYM